MYKSTKALPPEFTRRKQFLKSSTVKRFTLFVQVVQQMKETIIILLENKRQTKI
jgi:hypothetical protein